MKKSAKYIVSFILLLAVLIPGIWFFYTSNSINDTFSPETFKPKIVNETSEKFYKDVVLSNLHEPLKNDFFPGKNFAAENFIHYSRYDYEGDSYDYSRAMDFLPSGDLLVATRLGHFLRYIPARKQVVPVAGIPGDIATEGYQAGFMDLAVDPDFDKTNVIFFSYVMARTNVSGKREYTPCVARATLASTDISIVMRYCVQAWSASPAQFGGALAFDKRGHLFFTVGDRSDRQRVQTLLTPWGKILRLDKNTLQVPRDNPFENEDHKKTAVWSIGHRNPQGLFYDQDKDLLYAVEHGPEGGDEVNIIQRGINYGWPVITYGKEYGSHAAIGEGFLKPDMAQPLYYYVPSVSPSSVLRYHGRMFPEWRGSLFMSTLSGQHLNHLNLKSGKIISEERFLGYLKMRFRDIKEGPDGDIFLLSENGYLLRLYR